MTTRLNSLPSVTSLTRTGCGGKCREALFGDEVGMESWTRPDPPDQPDPILDLKEAHLLEISDRLPRNSSSLLVLIEHYWMDELSDSILSPVTWSPMDGSRSALW